MAVLSHFREFIAYWQELRGDKPVPSRADFRPVRVRHLLPRMIIVERDEAGEFVVRLAGTEIVERLGEEITYRNFFKNGSHLEEDIGVLKDLYDSMLSWPMGLTGTREWVTDTETYDSHFLHLPFSHKEGKPNELMILLHFDIPYSTALTNPVARIGDVRDRTLVDLGQGIDPAYAPMPSVQLIPA